MNLCIGLFLLFVLFENKVSVIAKNGCTINPVQETTSPFVITSGSSEFIYPDAFKKSLTFLSGESVDFICPGSVLKVSSERKRSVGSATCVEGEIFNVDGKQVKWSEIICSEEAVHTAKYNEIKCGNNKGKEIEVGYDTGDGRFLTLYVICFNQSTQEALYSYHNISLDIEEETSCHRPSWEQVDEFYTIGKATKYYYRSNQRKTINTLLGLSSTSTKYIQDGDEYYLARGHMTAKADNFYPSQQNASFMMMNVAPQWQIFNGGNWEKVESSVRKYAQNNDVNIQVYTGVYGVATLPHSSTGKETELWLYVDHNGNAALPVPEIYWKVAYIAESKKGVAIIGINNPYISEYKTICTDISKELSWLSWHKDVQEKGFGYACDINEFRKAVDFFPELNVKDLLE